MFSFWAKGITWLLRQLSKECFNTVSKSDPKKNSPSKAEGESSSAVVTPMHGRTKRQSALENDLLLLKEQLQQIEEQLENLSEVNASKVVDLHNRIAAGEYEFDPERIARKLMELESEINRQ